MDSPLPACFSRLATFLGLLVAIVPLGCSPSASSPSRPLTAVTETAATETGRSAESISPADASPADAGWPNLFGPTNDSVSRERGLEFQWPSEGPPLRWARDVGTGYSSLVAHDSQLIVLHRVDREELVECLDPETGDTIWKYAYPTKYVNKYHYSHGPYSTPAMDATHVYSVSATGELHCVRRADGQRQWMRPLYSEYGLEPDAFAVATSPLVDDQRVYFHLGAAEQQAGVIALDKRTGETLWTASGHAASCATPCLATIHDRPMLFVVTYEGLVALDPATGSEYWSLENRPKAPDSVNATSPIVVDDLVVMVTGPGPGALCLRVLADGGYEEVWRDRRVLDSQFNNLTCVDGHLFGYCSKRQDGSPFRCIDVRTGKLRWSWSSPLARGSVIAVDGHLVLWGEHGHLAALAIDTTQPIVRSLTAQPLLKTPCYSAPALHRGLLFVRNEQALQCYDLRSRAGLSGVSPPAAQPARPTEDGPASRTGDGREVELADGAESGGGAESGKGTESGEGAVSQLAAQDGC